MSSCSVTTRLHSNWSRAYMRRGSLFQEQSRGVFASMRPAPRAERRTRSALLQHSLTRPYSTHMLSRRLKACTCSPLVYTTRRSKGTVRYPSEAYELSSFDVWGSTDAGVSSQMRDASGVRNVCGTRKQKVASATASYVDTLAAPVRLSQPHHSTHPHLLAPGELTPFISADEYESRRHALMEPLEPGALVVIAAATLKYVSQNIFYKFRQATNFFYLTGWEEPDSVLVLERTQQGYEMHLFCRAKNAHDELWNGPRNGLDAARDVFGADEAWDITTLESQLRRMLSSSRAPVYVDAPGVALAAERERRPTPPAPSLLERLTAPPPGGVLAQLTGRGPRAAFAAAPAIERLRVVKSPAELRAMAHAAAISAGAHNATRDALAAMGGGGEPLTSGSPLRGGETLASSSSGSTRWATPNFRADPLDTAPQLLSEHTLVADFERYCAARGSARLAYVPVCASGANALSLHYTANNQLVRQGELLLLDAGCEYGGYASDVTRTFIAGGATPAQRELYAAAREVQVACIDAVTDGTNLNELHAHSVRLTRTVLANLGFKLSPGDLERHLYPHFVGHPLGLDLHDTMTFGRSEPLRPGMVITIEPGISVPDLPRFPKAFRGMVMRLEDEVVVPEKGKAPLVLSEGADK